MYALCLLCFATVWTLRYLFFTPPQVGDRVIALVRSGLWQNLVVVPAVRTTVMPDEMSFEEGAALPISYVTAYLMLFEMANLKPGNSVLVHMAAGTVVINWGGVKYISRTPLLCYVGENAI